MIKSLRLQQFRSYKDASFEFSSRVNIIVGPNASGKTSLLEAMLVLCRGSSYRAKDSELVQLNKTWSRLEAELIDGKKRVIKIKTNPTPEKTFEVDERPQKNLSETNKIPSVLFEPDHLQLLYGNPERRRDYLDDLLEQTELGYETIRRKYRRALMQRNALLKQINPPNQAELFPWNVRLCELGGKIIRARSRLVEQANKQAEEIYKNLSGTKTRFELKYQTTLQEGYESNFLRELEVNTKSDHKKGFTTTGPHRDDLIVLFSDHPVQEIASRGEVRTGVLTLKISELQLIRDVKNQTPLLLLDDVYSELDGKHRHSLTDYICNNYQVFITTTDTDDALRHIGKGHKIIQIKPGKNGTSHSE
jgi:DNA replication and repair protein RecF